MKKLNLRYASLVISLFLSVAAVHANAQQDEIIPDSFEVAGAVSDLPNFHEVIKSQIYRGGQPSPTGIQQLAKMGIKTIVNLRAESPSTSQKEEALAKSLGMNYFYQPMHPTQTPDDAQVGQIENSLLSNPALRPVFVHCHLGEDRTGVIIALHRVFRETPAFTPQQAYQEMLNLGFHTNLQELLNYYFAKTQWRPF